LTDSYGAALLYDHFDTDGFLDPSLWYFQTNSGGSGWSISESILAISSGTTAGGGAWVHSKQEFMPGDETLTLEIRAKVSAADGGYWGLYKDGGGVAGFSVDYNTGDLIMSTRNTVDVSRLVVTDIDVTTWHIYRIEISGSVAKFFVDGELQATQTENVPQYKLMVIRLDRVSQGQNQILSVDYAQINTDTSTPIDTPTPTSTSTPNTTPSPDGVVKIYLPAVVNQRETISFSEIAPDENGQVQVRTPDGDMVNFQLVSESGGFVTEASGTTIADSWGVTLIVIDSSGEHLPTITSVPTASIMSSGETNLITNQDNSLYEVLMHHQPVSGVLVDDATNVNIEHLKQLPAKLETWEQTHLELETFSKTASWVTGFISMYDDPLEETLSAFGDHVLIKFGLHKFDFWNGVASFLHTDPAQKHIILTNTDLQIAIDLGSDPDFFTTGIIFGQVVDKITKVGIEGATVRLDSNPSYTTTTLYNGWYQLEGVSKGQHVVEAMKLGFDNGRWVSARGDVSVSPANTIVVPSINLDADNDLHELVSNGNLETGTAYPWRVYRAIRLDQPFIVDERPRLPVSMYALKLGALDTQYISYEEFTSRYVRMYISDGTSSAILSYIYRLEVVSGDGSNENDLFTTEICYLDLTEVCVPIKSYTPANQTNNSWITEHVDLYSLSDPDLSTFPADRPIWLKFTSSPATTHNAITTLYVDDVSILLGEETTE
jgi:hypothetical protein